MTDKELDRNAARRLAIIKHAQEVTGNVAMTCRYYGISRQVFYRWYRRYQEEGLAGLRDRSTRPLTCPHETPAEVVAKIIYLRQNYHFGPAKISMYLKRYHDIQISQSGVWRILQRVDLSRLPGPPAVQAGRPQVEALRETAARARGPGRRQVHRPAGELEPQEVLPVHRH